MIIESKKGYYYRIYKYGRKVRISKKTYLKMKLKQNIKNNLILNGGNKNTKQQITLIRHGHSGSNAYPILDNKLNKLDRNKINKISKLITGFGLSLNQLIQDPSLSHLGIFQTIHNYPKYKKHKYDIILCSSMLRAIQTAILLFPNSKIFIIPFINEISKAGIERIITGKKRLPICKKDIQPKIELTFKYFKEKRLEKLNEIYYDDIELIQKIREHQEYTNNFNNCEIKWDIYDYYLNKYEEKYLFYPNLKIVFNEILPLMNKNKLIKIAVITHGNTIVSRDDPVGWLYYIKSHNENIYKNEKTRDDFNKNIFNNLNYKYAFSNTSSIRFIISSNKVSKLRCLYPNNLNKTYSCYYKNNNIEFNLQCPNKNKNILVKEYFKFKINLNNKVSLGQEIYFCKHFLSDNQTNTYDIKFKLLKNNKSIIPNKISNIKYWQNIDEKLQHKDIYMIYNNQKKIKEKGFFKLFYGVLEGELNNSSKYLLSMNKNIFLEVIPNNGLIIVCSKNNELNNPNKWRLLNQETINVLKGKSATNIRKIIYSIISSDSEFIKHTIKWKNNILSYEKQFLINICKYYNNNINKCEIIISREELMNFI